MKTSTLVVGVCVAVVGVAVLVRTGRLRRWTQDVHRSQWKRVYDELMAQGSGSPQVLLFAKWWDAKFETAIEAESLTASMSKFWADFARAAVELQSPSSDPTTMLGALAGYGGAAKQESALQNMWSAITSASNEAAKDDRDFSKLFAQFDKQIRHAMRTNRIEEGIVKFQQFFEQLSDHEQYHRIQKLLEEQEKKVMDAFKRTK